MQSLSAREWEEWLEFYALEPFGPQVDDLRGGMLCAAVLAPHFKRGSAPDPQDYMVRRQDERELSVAETASLLDALFHPTVLAEPVRASQEI